MTRFIEQTAKDYGIDVEIVEGIYRDYPPGSGYFYDRLESYLKEHEEYDPDWASKIWVGDRKVG